MHASSRHEIRQQKKKQARHKTVVVEKQHLWAHFRAEKREGRTQLEKETLKREAVRSNANNRQREQAAEGNRRCSRLGRRSRALRIHWPTTTPRKETHNQRPKIAYAHYQVLGTVYMVKRAEISRGSRTPKSSIKQNFNAKTCITLKVYKIYTDHFANKCRHVFWGSKHVQTNTMPRSTSPGQTIDQSNKPGPRPINQNVECEATSKSDSPRGRRRLSTAPPG